MSAIDCFSHGPLARYVKLRVARAPGMSVTFSPPPRVSYPANSRFPWKSEAGKRSQRMRNPQFYVSGKSSMWLRSLLGISHGIITSVQLGCINPCTHGPPHGLTLIPTSVSNYIYYKVWCELCIHSQTSIVQQLKFGNGEAISTHTLMDMWLLIHAGVEVELCS